MDDFSLLSSKEAVFNYLDIYADQQRSAMKKKNLKSKTGVIKSYMIETEQHEGAISNLFRESDLRLTTIDEGFSSVTVESEQYGFLEEYDSRYLIFHTIQLSNKADYIVRKTIQKSAQLDFVWLPGHYLNVIWDAIIKPQFAGRFVKMMFEYDDVFSRDFIDDSNEVLRLPHKYVLDEEGDDIVPGHQARMSLGMSARQMANVLPGLQQTLNSFRVMTRLRMPSADVPAGGYDFWDWGKVTYRSPSFRDGLARVYSIIELYQKATKTIESICWFHAEQTDIRGEAGSITFTGAPVSFVFPTPLEPITFQNFVKTVFERGTTSFGLWGNPIYLSENTVHVYGIDMHLWQKIYLELTPARFVLILPKNTCGNTVHRMLTNIQRYLSPDVQAYIGDYTYTEIVLSALLGGDILQ